MLTIFVVVFLLLIRYVFNKRIEKKKKEGRESNGLISYNSHQ